MPLKVGDKAPDFTAWSTAGGDKVGDPTTLSDVWKNKNVVLAFFPLAFTGG